VVVAPSAGALVVVELDVVLDAVAGRAVVLGPPAARSCAPLQPAATKAIEAAKATTLTLSLGFKMTGR
jgi:hypothetical protein